MTYRYTEKQLNARSKRTPNQDNMSNKTSLTDQQFDDLKCYYASDYVDTLSVNELKDIVYENMLDNLEEYSQKDVINEVKSTFDKAYLRQLINQVMNNKAPPISDPW